jgi:hypothetical protein
MDPDVLLENIREAFKDVSMSDMLPELVEAMDEWLSRGGFLPKAWVSTEPSTTANGARRMSQAQRNKLWELCGRYNVPFREDDYTRPGISPMSPPGYVEGWVGGFHHSDIGHKGYGDERQTIYVGVSPEGESHS